MPWRCAPWRAAPAEPAPVDETPFGGFAGGGLSLLPRAFHFDQEESRPGPRSRYLLTMKARCAGPMAILLCFLSDCAVARSSQPRSIRPSAFSAACPDGRPLPPDTMTLTVYLAPAPHGSSVAPRAPRAAAMDAVHAIAE